METLTANNPVTIAVTGHRDLRHQDISTIRKALNDKILELRNAYAHHSLQILTGDAEGADTLAIQIVKELNDPGIQFLSLKKTVPPHRDSKGLEILNDHYYHEQAQYIVENAQVIIALWDGIFTYKKGGTSEVVRMALESNRNITLHHLICPRISNPYVVNSLVKEMINNQTKPITQAPVIELFSWTKLEVNKENSG